MSREPIPDGYVQLAQFIDCLFSVGDVIAMRPIETWAEPHGQKCSRVVYREQKWLAASTITEAFFQNQLNMAAKEHANLFFGVCPRFSCDAKMTFDEAWQIRKANCLWADLDDCLPAEALERCRQASLPDPTITISSGNGTHLYWRLESPYLIDDVGDPPGISIESWVKTNGRRKPVKVFLNEHGERIYLSDPTTGAAIRGSQPKLSEKAQHVQDVLAGIAAAIGGDHTTDLARLLRLPGTWNRKNGRNGQESKPCIAVDFQQYRYPFVDFESRAGDSRGKQDRERVAAIRLPTVRNSISAGTQDKLNRLIDISRLEEQDRSGADFAVCCEAIRRGVTRDALWMMVRDVGKFRERREDYFSLTWENAANQVRLEIHSELTHKRGRTAASTQNTKNNEIVFSPQEMPVSELFSQITQRLISAGNYYCRAGELVDIRDWEVNSIDSPYHLIGALSSLADFVTVDGDATRYDTLPHRHASAWIHNPVEIKRVPEMTLFTRSPVFTQDYRLVAPGYDKETGIFYAGPKIDPGNGTDQLDRLLLEFCWREPADRTNFISMLLTIVLVSKFIGAKPGALFTGNQPGLGKTILSQIIAILRDGHTATTCSYVANDEEFEKRLCARVRSSQTTIIIDNAKGGRGHAARIESAALERSITDETLSFRLLGFSREVRCENSHIFCITANTPDVSPDIMSRCVPINLFHEGAPERRKFTMANPEGYAEECREALLAELLGMVERWKHAGMPLAALNHRFNKRGWANIVGGILSVNGEPDFLDNLSNSAQELDSTKREFAELVGVVAEMDRDARPLRPTDWKGIATNKRLLLSELGDGSERSKATRMGFVLGQFVDESFQTPDGCWYLRKDEDRHGNQYCLEGMAVPDVAHAEKCER